MVSEAPPFWWSKSDWRAWSLMPVSWIYGAVARSRMEKAPRVEVDAPVICVGNLTVGGAGKTPTALALATVAKKAGFVPGFLSRGYRGSLRTTTVVEPDHHNARDVGDEPLLLAARAKTVVSPDRHKGAERLIEEGVNMIIMDDGFQSAAIHFDFALVVIDALRGIGNGHVIPGGPMRAPLLDQMREASALLVIGEGTAADSVIRMAGRAAKPVYTARFKVQKPRSYKNCRMLAFAAIGNPEKFFDSLRSVGADVVIARGFGDHHEYSEEEAAELLEQAAKQDLELVTTSKDMARLKGAHGPAAELAAKTRVLEVKLDIDPADQANEIIDKAVQAFKKRRLMASNYDPG